MSTIDELVNNETATINPIEYLAQHGATFTLCKAGEKRPIGKAWQDKPHTAATAKKHLASGGAVGLLTGEKSGGLHLIDIDYDLETFARLFPNLSGYPSIRRRNAKHKAKFIIRINGTIENQKYKHPVSGANVFELLGTGNHGLIVGEHESGAQYELFDAGDIPTIEAEMIPIIAERFTDALKPPVWNIITVGDAFKPRPPVQYAVNGIIERPSLNIVYGAPSSMKSMVVLDMAMDVATGRTWLPVPDGGGNNSGGVRTTQAAVLWIDLDNGKRRTMERTEAIARARGATADTPLYNVSMPNPTVALDDPSSVVNIIDMINHVGAGFVVLDNLGLISGNVEENSAGMTKILGQLRMISERCNVAIIVIHHQRKSSGNGDGRAGDSVRGSSGIEAATDLCLRVDRIDNQEIKCTPTKMRGATFEPFHAVFSYEHKPNTDKELMSCRFFGKVVSNPNSNENIIRAIVDIGEPLPKTTLAKKLREDYGIDVGKNALLDRLESLAESGAIVCESPDGNKKLMSVRNIQL